MELTLVLCLAAVAAAAPQYKGARQAWGTRTRPLRIQLGPRPYYIIDQMDDGDLKTRLQSCVDMDMRTTKFSIGHRGGGTLQFPEATLESVDAGTRMGSGVQECDVTFTKDRQLVCRHSQCDLHTTTNILATDLASKCAEPFQPFDGETGAEATARCCTSDITLDEYKSLCGKMDGANVNATTVDEYLDGTPSWRTDLYSQCGTVLSHREFISLVDDMGLDFTPELKTPQVDMPFDGTYTQDMFAAQMIDEYVSAGIRPHRVWPQSFLYDDVLFWLSEYPDFGRQAVYLDDTGDTPETFPLAVANLANYAADGVHVVAPPLQYLVTLDEHDNIVPSVYATTAKQLNLDIITWSLERSGRLGDADQGGYYYTSIANVTDSDGVVYELLDVLAREVGVLGVFTDWSATVTYYANCFGLL